MIHSMIRQRYLSSLFVGRLFAAILGLAGLLQLLDLLDNASDVLARGGLLDLARYAAWRLPSVVAQMLPLAVLVAGMLTLRRLAMTLEMAALRSAGLSVRWVMMAMLPACLLAAVVQAGLLGYVAPHTERALSEWMAATDSRVTKRVVVAPRRIWMRAGRQVISIDRVSTDGKALDDVLVVTRTPDLLLDKRVEARSAAYGPGGWTLFGVRITQPGHEGIVQEAQQPWPEGPSPAEIIEVVRPTNAQTLSLLTRSLRGEQATGRGPAFFTTRLHETAARLLAPFIMLLLAAPVAFAVPRAGAQMAPPLLCLAAGLTYLLAGGLMGALGEAGVIAAPLAVWAPPIVFATLGAMMLLRYDER